MAISAEKDAKLRAALETVLGRVPELRKSYRGIRRKGIVTPCVMVEFDWPEPTGVAGTGGRRDYRWGYILTFAFDDEDPEKADAQWGRICVAFVNALADAFSVLSPTPNPFAGLAASYALENLAPPDHPPPEQGKPTMYKAIRFAPESEEIA